MEYLIVKNGINTNQNQKTEDKTAIILWDFTIQTDSKIKSNRPNIVAKDYKRKICLLIDMFVPTDYNILVKEYNEISKYKDLEIETEKNMFL